LLVAALFVGVAAVSIVHAVGDQSVHWPDEIHQSLEPAHRAAFGYGFVPWEFRDGARSWVYPGAIAGFWKVCSWLGIDSGRGLIFAARFAFIGVFLLAIGLAMRLGRRCEGEDAGLVAGVLVASFPPAMLFAYRGMSEMASLPLILGALIAGMSPGRSRQWLAGGLLAAAVFVRPQSGIVALFLLVWLLAQRRRDDAVFAIEGLAVVGLLGGLLDWATWGIAFHSLFAYLDFNLVQGKASGFGTEPWSFYLTALWTSIGPAALPIACCFIVGAVKHRGLALLVLAYLIAHSAVPHKELRFAMPIAPVALVVAACGATRIARWFAGRWPTARAPARWIAVAVAGVMVFQAVRFTRGVGRGDRAYQLARFKSASVNALLLSAGDKDDLCGLALLGSGAASTGGYSYLHRDLPVVWTDELCESPLAFNYAIAPISSPYLSDEFALVQQRGRTGLYRRAGQCEGPAPASTRPLPGAGRLGLAPERRVRRAATCDRKERRRALRLARRER
jgi:hypothetical protein